MIRIGRTDEFVIGNIEAVADSSYDACDTVDELLGGDPFRRSFLLYLLTVLIGSGLEKDIEALLSLMSCDGIRHDYLIRISYMGFA